MLHFEYCIKLKKENILKWYFELSWPENSKKYECIIKFNKIITKNYKQNSLITIKPNLTI